MSKEIPEGNDSPYIALLKTIFNVQSEFCLTNPVTLFCPIEEMESVVQWMKDNNVARERVILKDVEDFEEPKTEGEIR